jgi:hypothetical protein
MTVTVTTEPTLIIPSREAQVTCTASSGNFVRVVCTAGPVGSAIQKQIDDESRNELQLWSEDSGVKKGFTFDLPGSYVCTLREYTKGGVTFGGDYAEDPSGYKSETAIGETAYTFVVGQKMTAPINVKDDRGTLTIYVWGDTIRGTTIPTHGEQTPRIDAATQRMRTAVETAAVQAKLTALEDVAASSAVTSLTTVANDIISKFNSHLVSAAHTNADTKNSIVVSYTQAGTPDALRETVTKIAGNMRQHFTNDSGTGAGVGSASYHATGDWDDLPLVNEASQTVRAGLALASIWHSYEVHRVNTTYHASTDAVNVLATLPPLLQVYQSVVEVLQTDDPTAPATDNSGATVLMHRAGLEKA